MEEDGLRCGIRSRRAILTMCGSFRQCLAGLCSSSSEEVAQWTVYAQLPCYCFAQQSWTRFRCLEDVCLPIYFGILSNRLSFVWQIYPSRLLSWSIQILCSTDCHDHSEMVRLLCLILYSSRLYLALEIRFVAQSEV